ncbi:MAG: hypothetical protein ACJAS9_003797, partial [Polaribacter sp.]
DCRLLFSHSKIYMTPQHSTSSTCGVVDIFCFA